MLRPAAPRSMPSTTLPGTYSSRIETLIERHLPTVIEHLRPLERALAELHHRLVTHELSPGRFGPAAVYHPATDGHWRTDRAAHCVHRIADALRRITYDDEQAPNRSHVLPGALGVPLTLIDHLRTINTLKHSLKAACAPLHEYRFRIPVPAPTGPPRIERRQLVTLILRRLDRADLNLLAAYREIPFVDEPIRALHHTVTHAQSIPRATARALIEILEDNPSARALQDLSRLRLLPPDEHLVSPKARYRRLRAHAYPLHGPHPTHRLYADLPVLFLVTARASRPLLRPPPRRAAPARRADPHIEDTPVVETLRYYRKLPGFRTYAGRARPTAPPRHHPRGSLHPTPAHPDPSERRSRRRPPPRSPYPPLEPRRLPPGTTRPPPPASPHPARRRACPPRHRTRSTAHPTHSRRIPSMSPFGSLPPNSVPGPSKRSNNRSPFAKRPRTTSP